MAKPTGFIEYPREEMKVIPVSKRKQNYNEFESVQTNIRVRTQAARCIDCGVPYCNWGCPLNNLIPEFNNLVYENQWEEAYKNLISTNNFPEFTGRLCPAPCEPACTAAIVDQAISIKHIELAIIEYAFKQGWVVPKKIKNRSIYKIAIIGSGPAGLAAANILNTYGHNITVFDKNKKIGGLLTYGIPDFKIEKSVVNRRVKILEEEGIKFKTNCHIGKNISITKILKDFDYIGLCCGAEEQIKIDLPGINKKGVVMAMDYLCAQNRLNSNEVNKISPIIDAKGKDVVIIGGGDTSIDCIGTANRQNAKSVTQLQLHKKPPLERYPTNPWPKWPKIFKQSFSHEEGCKRIFSHQTCRLIGKNKVEAVELEEIVWPKGEIKSGMRNYKLTGNKKVIPCQLFIVALGFSHPIHNEIFKSLKLKLDKYGNVLVKNFKTSYPNIFASGDMVEGASLIVTAISSGRKMAEKINKEIVG